MHQSYAWKRFSVARLFVTFNTKVTFMSDVSCFHFYFILSFLSMLLKTDLKTLLLKNCRFELIWDLEKQTYSLLAYSERLIRYIRTWHVVFHIYITRSTYLHYLLIILKISSIINFTLRIPLVICIPYPHQHSLYAYVFDFQKNSLS